MKKIITGICCLIAFTNTYSIDTLKSKVSDVTVFLSGAQVFRTSSNTYIKKGISEFIIKDVSPQVNQNQIQASSNGKFLILDVQYKTEFVEPPRIKPKYW